MTKLHHTFGMMHYTHSSVSQSNWHKTVPSP